MKKYGIKLKLYAGQPFNMWVQGDNGRFETTDQIEAFKVRDEWVARNPKGLYDVEEIE